MRFARWVFLIAGVTGALGLLAAFFSEAKIGTDLPPAITHPEFFYGFIASALVWQLMFLLIASDPARFRVLMPLAVLEKFAFFVPSMVLYLGGRLAAGGPFGASLVDGGFMVLFAIAWWRMRGQPG
jgi:hypothetical protein